MLKWNAAASYSTQAHRGQDDNRVLNLEMMHIDEQLQKHAKTFKYGPSTPFCLGLGYPMGLRKYEPATEEESE